VNLTDPFDALGRTELQAPVKPKPSVALYSCPG
jgi:hypothetical protein